MRISKAIEFQWDKGNIGKNLKHGVTDTEAEQVFFDNNKAITEDIRHSIREKLFIVIGQTKKSRLLYTIFTMRGKYIRIISSRDTSKKEVKFYEKAA